MVHRAIRVLGASLVCGAVGAALPLVNLIRVTARKKHLDRDVQDMHARLETSHQDAEQCRRRLSDAQRLIRTLESEVQEHKLQKNEDDATIKRLRDDEGQLRASLEEVQHKLQLSLAKEKEQEARIAEMLGREPELNHGGRTRELEHNTAAEVDMEQNADQEHVSPETSAIESNEKDIDSLPNLATVHAEAKNKPADMNKPMENPPKASNPEARLRQEGSLEESMLLTISSGEPLDPDVYLTPRLSRNKRRRKRKPSSKTAKNRARELEKERLDSALSEYFAKETVHRRSTRSLSGTE